MINISEIVISSIDENLESFTNEVQNSPSQNDLESDLRVNNALMNYSRLLLEKYHQSLKSELAKQGIEI